MILLRNVEEMLLRFKRTRQLKYFLIGKKNYLTRLSYLYQ